MINIYKKIFLSYFKDKKLDGVLELITKESKYSFGSEVTEGREGIVTGVEIKVLNDKFFKRVILFGDIGLGEAYFLKYFETSDLKNLLIWFIQNKNNVPGFNEKNKTYVFFEWAKLISKIFHYLNKNTISGSKRNIKKHYDVSNDFYKLWLDDTMTYSSAVFYYDLSLKDAQLNKYRKICKKINLKESDHVLEIGSGWGGFAIYAVKNYNCKVTTITISVEQYKLAKDRIKKEGLEEKIEIKLEDYRKVQGKYEKIVSIEMMEALGHEYVPKFVSVCNEALKTGGRMFYQCITIRDRIFREYLKNSNYIKKYIFPGGELISLGQLKRDIKKENLKIYSIENIGQDYAKTLNKWRENFLNCKDEIFKLGFDEIFFRKWLYYFIYCEAGFQTGYLDDAQILIHKGD